MASFYLIFILHNIKKLNIIIIFLLNNILFYPVQLGIQILMSWFGLELKVVQKIKEYVSNWGLSLISASTRISVSQQIVIKCECVVRLSFISSSNCTSTKIANNRDL